MWNPGSGVVLDCIHSRSLPPFFTLKIQFDVFFNVIHERMIKFETFLHGCLVGRVAFIYAPLLK